jgi:DNA-binding transcriptional LysR family regulator
LLEAAAELEARAKRVASGYEVELRIAVDDLVPMDRLYPLLEAFYGNDCGTRLRLSVEVYGGTWDALLANRADLAIGAPGEGPPGGGYRTRPLGSVEWAFMVAPAHPLAAAREPIAPEVLIKHRTIAAADSSRNLPPRTSGLLSGQDVLTVPDVRSKIAFQIAGLGAGYLPVHLTRAAVQSGQLIVKRVVEPRPASTQFIAWPTAHRGKALGWFLDRLDDPDLCASLLA